MRNWKERWDPNAEFVFNKTMNLGLDSENPRVVPGDPVDKTTLGLRRLQHWWNAGFIRLDKTADNAPKPCIIRITTNCYEVRIPGKKIIRVNTKQEADATLRALTGKLLKKGEDAESAPYIEKLNKLIWALHTSEGVEKVKGMPQAIARLHEVTRGR